MADLIYYGSEDRNDAVLFVPAGLVIPPAAVPRHALAWTTDIRVRPVDNDTIEWDSGSVEFSDGVSQSVSDGTSPRTLSPSQNSGVWFVYKRFNSSTLQFTQSFTTAIGDDRIQIGIIVVSADANNMATVLIKGDSGGPHISAQSIAVNVLSAITANLGEVLAGIMTGVLIRTSATGRRIQISSSNVIEAFNATEIVGKLGIFSDPLGINPDYFTIESLGTSRDFGIASERNVGIFTNSPAGSEQFQGVISLRAKSVNFDLSGPGRQLNLTGAQIVNAGDIELDSLTKDGVGAIVVNDDIDMNNHRILNVAGLGGTNVLDGASVTLDPANFGNNLPVSIIDVQALADAIDDLVLGVGGGQPVITADVDFGGFDALDVGDVVLDALRKAGSGKIDIESIVEFGSNTEIHFEGNELTDIGEEIRRAANIWANGIIVNAMALRDGQDFAAQAGRTVIYVEGSGSSRQVKIRYPDGTTADLPGTGGEPGTDDQTAAEVSLDPSSFGGKHSRHRSECASLR